MKDQSAENDAHTLVVEHANQGTEMTQGEEGHLFTVHYIIRHPDNCDRDECAIDLHIRDVGIEDTLGLNRWEGRKSILGHLPDGLYALDYWSQRYSGPNGDDWDAGVDVARVIPPVEGR